MAIVGGGVGEEVEMGLTPEEFDKAKDEATAPAQEVMAHLYRALLTIPAFTLSDGTAAVIEPYYPPQEADADGELSCGVDVQLANGTHLEFTVKNTGWGKSFVAAIANKPVKPTRQR